MGLIDNIKAHKTSDTAVLFGSGSSISRLSQDDWLVLKQFDTWTWNDFAYHNFIFPKFYFIQPKPYDFCFIQHEFKQKSEAYKDTVFFYHINKTVFLNDRSYLPQEVLVHQILTMRRIGFILNKRRPANVDYTFDEEKLTCSCNASISFILEAIYRVGYKRVVLYGVDLYNSRYFWEDEKLYLNVHHRTNKQQDPNLPHTTHRVKHFVYDANIKWFKSKLFVGHTDTELYPTLDLLELHHE